MAQKRIGLREVLVDGRSLRVILDAYNVSYMDFQTLYTIIVHEIGESMLGAPPTMTIKPGDKGMKYALEQIGFQVTVTKDDDFDRWFLEAKIRQVTGVINEIVYVAPRAHIVGHLLERLKQDVDRVYVISSFRQSLNQPMELRSACTNGSFLLRDFDEYVERLRLLHPGPARIAV